MIYNAALQKTVLEAAISYKVLRYSVVPVVGKVCPIRWAKYQGVRASLNDIKGWYNDEFLNGVAIVCGAVSNNLVVLDLDGIEAVQDFRETFPHFTETYSVRTGSGQGEHYYFHVRSLPDTTIAPGYELRSNGAYVVAPPSIHPVTDKPYRVMSSRSVMELETAAVLVDWVISKRPPAAPVPVTPISPKPFPGHVASGRYERYAAAIVERQLDELQRTTANVNNKLNAVSYRLARFAANPVYGLSETELKASILQAARHLTARDGFNKTYRTMESGWNAGYERPADLPKG